MGIEYDSSLCDKAQDKVKLEGVVDQVSELSC